MARMARLVVPNYPHHVVQRGSRRQPTFFGNSDYRMYLQLVADTKEKFGVNFWAYCLMPNHVHLIVVPERKDSLARLCRSTHREYARRINQREGWRGHLWQERFHSFVMDEEYLLAAVRYVELNPVRAGLCNHAADWPWSSARAHLQARSDILVDVKPMRERIQDWSAYLDTEVPRAKTDVIRDHIGTGRPAGSDKFIDELEGRTGRVLRKRRAGRKSAAN